MKPMKISKALDKGVSILLDEIRLAIKWNRPSILLAVQKFKPLRSKGEASLEKKMEMIGQQVVHVRPGERLPDLPRLLSPDTTSENMIYFFSLLESRQEDPLDFYRSLNLYRETFIENRIRAVFWLTEVEAADMVRFAPDFWSFRHRVVEFAPPRNPRGISMH